MNRFEKQINFILEINKAKDIFRQSLLPGSFRNENDAEHSWHLAVMAMILEEYMQPGTDVLKVVKLVLIHDLVEIYAGDTYCYDETANEDKYKRELAAAEKLFGMLEIDQKDYINDLWHEFEDGKTKEAEFANIIDRLQPLLLHIGTEAKSWLDHKVTKDQVLKRMEIVINYGGEIKEFTLKTINSFADDGYLIV